MPTMNDVAKLAGVSRGTVSNYINGVRVKEASQKKIQEAIDELGYIPNITARELKMNRSNLVIFIVPTTQTPFFAELTYQMQRALKKEQFKMILCTSNNDIAEELEYIQMSREQKAAGIITISYSDFSSELTHDIPIVSIEKKISETIPCVTSDNYMGGKLAAKKLSESGASNLLMITRTTDKTITNYGERTRGFVDYCEEYNIPYEVFNSKYHEDKFFNELSQFLRQNYQNNIPHDGIFAVADQYADFSLDILKQCGLTSPNDFQIIGFDGGKMYEYQNHPLSSIRQPIPEIVTKCVSILQDILKGKKETNEETIVLPVEFIQGKTTKRIL
ncbi:LacI family DNA-binding transcriptional regulator [Vagococcus sp. JNUCC 83]